MKTIDLEFLRKNKHIFNHKKCVFIVGAGISVESGIPDFRSPTGIFATLKQQLRINGRDLFTYNFGIKEGSRQIYLKYICSLKTLCDTASPNETHRFLANYPKSRTYTQNIDGLEERAGMDFIKKDNTKGVYLHGNLSYLACQYCGFRKEFTAEDIKSFEQTEEIECAQCQERRERCIKNGTRKRPMGYMHPGIIHYHQMHPDGAFIGRMCAKDMDCDLLIVMGTSLSVDGIKKLVKTFSRCPNVYGKRILVNLTPPSKEWSDVFDFFFNGDCKDFIREISLLKNIKIDIAPIGAKISNSKPCNPIHDLCGLQPSNRNLSDLDLSGLCNPSHDLCGLQPSNRNLSDLGTSGLCNPSHNASDSELYNNDANDQLNSSNPISNETDAAALESNLRRISISSIDDRDGLSTRKSSLESKIETLSKSFSDEELISKPVLDDVLSTMSATEIQDSHFLDLEGEISNIVSQAMENADSEEGKPHKES